LQANGMLSLTSAGSLFDGGRLSSEVAPATANLQANSVRLDVGAQIGTAVSPVLVAATQGLQASSGLATGADGLMALRAVGTAVPLQVLNAGGGEAELWLSGVGFSAAASAADPLVQAGELVLDGLTGFGEEGDPIHTRVHALAGAVGRDGLYIANLGDLAITLAADRSGSHAYPGLSLAQGGSISSDVSLTLEGLLQNAAGTLSLQAADQLQLRQQAQVRLVDAASATLQATGGQLSSQAGSTITVDQGNLQLAGNGMVLQGSLNTGGDLSLEGGSASISLLPYLTDGQKQELQDAGIDPATLTSNLILAGSLTSRYAAGFSLQSDRLLALLGAIETTAAGASLQLQTSSSDGLLFLGNSLASGGDLSLQALDGPLYTGIPSQIRTSGTGSLSIKAASATLNGPIEAGSGGVKLQVGGRLTLTGATSSQGPVAAQAAVIALAASGGIVSLDDVSLAAIGTGPDSGLQLAGLLLAGGNIAPAALAATSGRRTSTRVPLDGQAAIESTDQTLQRGDIQLDPASKAVLQLSSASSAVIGGYSDGTNDTVVACAWLAAPELSISSVDRPTLLHDLIARDRLTIHSDTELNLRPIAVLNLGSPNPSDSGATTPEASLELTAPSINLSHDVADLVIEAETSAPQAFLTGNLREPLTLAFTVTTPGGQSAAFSAAVVAGQRNSLDELLVAINDALATAAGSAGLPLTSIPSLGLRGAYLRFQLGLFGDSPEQLAFGLEGALSSGLEQLGYIASRTNRQGVIPATVFSHALATSINAGSAAQPYDHLDWGGGVRADAASEQTSLGGTLHLAANASTAITAAVDVPVLKFTADQAAKLPENPDIFADAHPTGRTRELEIDSTGSFTLTSLVNTSSAPQLELVRYRSIEGSLTLEIGALPDQRQLSSSKPIELQAATVLSIKRDAAVADGPVALELPALQATAGGHLLLGDGLQLQLKPNGSPSPVKGLTLNGASVTISGSITSSSAITTTVTASAGDVNLQPGSVSRSVGFNLTGLRGDQTFTASDHLLQAMALGSTGGNSDSDSAPSISLQAGTGLISSAAITAASLQMATTSGLLRTDPQLYTNAAGDLVDPLGYRVDNQGVFVDESGGPLSPDQAPIYAGPPAAVLSGGAIQAPDLRLDAGSGTLLLQNSITPAGVSSTTLMASAFRAADHGFALAGAVPANGTAVRFYGVQAGALSNLKDGGTYWVVRSASAPGLLQLARSASDAASGQVIALSLAANLVGAAAVGQLLQAPQSQGSQAALRGGSIGMTQSATLQASNLTLTSAGAIDLLGEAWLLADRTTLDYSTSADLHIGRSRSDLRRALLQTEVLTLISAGGLLLDGYLDLTGSNATTLAFQRELTISGELTAQADLQITTPGHLAIIGAGSIESEGELTIKAESVQVAADATRAGWEKGTVITGVTPITTTATVQSGSAMQDLRLPFDAGAVAHLQVNIPTNTLQLVGLNGEPLRHGLQDATPLYYQSSGLANGAVGGAGLINTSPSTTDPSLGTRYDVLVLDATTFQLRRQNAIVPLTAAPFLDGDALDGLVVNSREVSSTTTETRQIGTTAVVTGYSWYTYGLNLLQDAFYSPTSQKIVEAFTPGIDFQINNVIWGSAGTPAADLPWNTYTPSQRQAVLDSLGYLPFYAIDVENVVKLASKDGQLSSTPVTNPWFNDPQVLVVPSSGALAGKAIVGPAAAFSDPYSLVSRDPGATQGLAMMTSVATAGPLSQPLNGLTLEAWVYLDPTSSSNGVILSSQLSSVDGGSATTPSFNLEVANGHLALVNDAGSVLISPSTVIGKETLAKGQWLHLAAAVTPGLGGSKGTASLFINGVEDTPTANQVTLDSSAHFQKLSISPAAATASLSGSIREVKVWGQTRTSAQVVEDMTQPPYGDLTAIAYWFPLDGTAESGIPDRPAATLAAGATFLDAHGINAPDPLGLWQEAVGDSVFNASVQYVQVGAALKSTALTQMVQNPSDPTKTLSLKADVVSTNQNGPLYKVSYKGNGLESITLERNRTVQNAGSFSTSTPISLTGDQQRKPYWVDNSNQSISSYDANNSQVYGIGKGLAPFLQGGTATPVLSPPGLAYTLSLTAAGGLALYGPDGAILWQATDANGKPVQGGVQALMQPDGNFVLYKTMQPLDGNGRSDAAIWSTGTITSGARLILTSQGGLQILNTSSQIVKTIYSAQLNSLILGSGATLLSGKGIASELLNKGYPAGLPESTLSTAPANLATWQTANVSYPSTGPKIAINPGNAPINMLEHYGPVLASTWENPQAVGLATHLDPGLQGSRLSFTFNRLDRWDSNSEIRLYYLQDGTTTPALIFSKALPSAKAATVELSHQEFMISDNKVFVDLIPRPFFGDLYGDPKSPENTNEQSFDVQVTLGAGVPAGNLVITAGPAIRNGFYPQFVVNNIRLALPDRPASLQAASSPDLKLDYINSTASLTGGAVSDPMIKEVGSIASPNPVDSNWAATPSPAWQYVQGQSPSASVFADVGSTRYQAVLGTDNHLFYSSSVNGGLNWGGWIMLPADMTSSSPPALASFNGALYLAYVGQDRDKKINITKYNSTSNSWGNLYQIPNQGAKTICMLAEGSNLAVYYQGLNDQIYRTSTSNPDSSGSWQLNPIEYKIGTGPDTASQTSSGQLAVASLDGTTYLAYQGGDSSNIKNTIYLTKSNNQALSSSWLLTGVPQPNTSNHAGVALARNQSSLVIGYADLDATGSVIFSLNQSSNGGSTWNPFATLKSVSGTSLVSPSGATTFSLLGLAGSAESRLLTSTITNNNALNIWNAAFDSPKDVDLTVSTGNGTGYNFFSMPSYGSSFFATPQYNQTTTWPVWGPSRTLQEIWNSYNYNWQSIPFENTDQRQNLSFSATSRPEAITTLEPVYQQYDITTTRTIAQLDPNQTLRPVYVSETRNNGVQVQTQSVDIRGAAVRFDSLRGRSVNVSTGSRSQFAGNLTASAEGKVTISSDGSLGFSATQAPAPVDPSTPISTIAAAEIQLNAANGLTLGSGLLLAGNGDQPNRSIVLAAGSSSLQSEALIAPTTQLSLAGVDLSLPLGGTRPLQAQSINLDFGSLLNLQASQANAMASPLLLELGNAPTGVDNGIRLTQPDPAGSLRIKHLQATLPVTVDDAGSLDLAGSISGRILDLEARNLVLSTVTSLEASESLILDQQGDSRLSSNDLVVVAPSLALSSGGDLDLQVNTADLKVSGAGAVKIQNLSTNRSRLAVSGAGTQQFSVRSELVLDGLNTGFGDVTIAVDSGDLWLGSVHQSTAGSLTLIAANGQIGNLSQVQQDQRQLGALWVYAAADVNLDLQGLNRLNATSEAGNIHFSLAGAPADLMNLESLRAPSGDVILNAGLAAVSLLNPDQIQAVNLSLSTNQGLLINDRQLSTLKARDRIYLGFRDLQGDPTKLSLETENPQGSVQIYFSQLALADALPTLPLLSTGHVQLRGEGGMRLTDTSFGANQNQVPLHSLLFSAIPSGSGPVSAGLLSGNLETKSLGAISVPVYWPYERVLVTQILEDESGIPYVLKSDSGGSNGAAPVPQTHYQPDDTLAPGLPYRYQALRASQAFVSSNSSDLVVQFRSDQKLLTLNNLSQANLWGISASEIDPATIQPILQTQPVASTSLHAMQTTGTPKATALLTLGEENKAVALQDSQFGSLQPTAVLSRLIQQPAVIIVASVDPSLAGASVSVDVVSDPSSANSRALLSSSARSVDRSLEPASGAPFTSDGLSTPQKVSAVVSSAGLLRLALDSAPAPDVLLALETSLNGASLTLLATPDRPSFSDQGSLELLLRRLGLAQPAVAASLGWFDPLSGGSDPLTAPLAGVQQRLALHLACSLADRFGLSRLKLYEVLASAVAAQAKNGSHQQDWGALARELLAGVIQAAPAAAVHQLSLLPAVLAAWMPQLQRVWSGLQASRGRFGSDADLLAASSALADAVLQRLPAQLDSLFDGRQSAGDLLPDLARWLSMGAPAPATATDPQISVVPFGRSALSSGQVHFEVRLPVTAPSGGLQVNYRITGLQNTQGQVVIPEGESSALVSVSVGADSPKTNGSVVLQLMEAPNGYRISPGQGAARVSVKPPAALSGVTPTEPPLLVQGTVGDDLLSSAESETSFFSGPGRDRIVIKPPSGSPDQVLDFDPAQGDRLVLLRSDFPGVSLNDLAIVQNQLMLGDRPLAGLRSPQATSYPFVLDVSNLVELENAPAPPAPLPVRPEPGTRLQSVLAGSLGLVNANASDNRVTLVSDSAATPSANDALVWNGNGLVLGASVSGARLITLQALAGESLAQEQISIQLYLSDAMGRPLAPDGVSLAASAQAAVIAQVGCVPDDAGKILFGGSTSMLLKPGQQLSALVSRRNAPVQILTPMKVIADGQGLRLHLGPIDRPDLILQASIGMAETVDLQLEIASRIGLNGLLFLNDGEQVTLDLLSNCALTNTLGFVKVDIDSSDPAQPRISVAGRPVSNDDAFRQVVLEHLDPGLRVSQGGHMRSSHVWTVSSGTGFYSPVMLSGRGEIFVLGAAFNRDQRVHLKGIGDGAYAFEDLAADQGSDFDYNDAVFILRRNNNATMNVSGDVVLASGAGTFELAGPINTLLGDSQRQVVRTSGLRANQLQLGAGSDMVLRQGHQADSIFMGADDDVLVLGRQGGGGTMRLGAGRDRVIIGAGTLTSNHGSPDRITDFNPADDRILVVGNAALTVLDSSSGLMVSLDGQPVLLLEGIHDRQQLDAAISLERQSPGDRIDRLAQRGVLTVSLPADRPGLSQRSADGIWSGYAVDFVRAMAEQLFGNPALVLFAEPVGDAERLTSLRNGHIDLALIDGDGIAADLAGDADRSWTLPAAGPAGPLTFLLPENETRFRQTINRLLQTPLQALRLGLSSSNLPVADAPELPTQVRRFLDLVAPPSSSDAGAGLPLQQGFVRKVLNRLGNASQLWQRFFGPDAPAGRTIDPASTPLDLPLAGPALQSTALDWRKDDALATLLKRGELRLAVAADSSGQPNLSAQQQRQLLQLVAALGREGNPLPLKFVTMGSANEGLDLLVSGAVDLLLPDAFSTLWFDGVVGVDSIAGDADDSAVLLVTRSSGIKGFSDLDGSRLGLSGGSQVATALSMQLSQVGVQASLVSFSNSEDALQALQRGRLDGVVLRRSVVSDAQRRLVNLGIDTMPLPDPVYSGTSQWLVAADQSPLRDTLQAVTIVLGRARDLGLQRSQVEDAYRQVQEGSAAPALQKVFDPDGNRGRDGVLSSSQIQRLLLTALD